jgi:hypothetical protein
VHPQQPIEEDQSTPELKNLKWRNSGMSTVPVAPVGDPSEIVFIKQQQVSHFYVAA